MIDLYSGYSGSSPEELTVLGDILYMSADADSHGRELWGYDLSTGTAALVEDYRLGSPDSNPARSSGCWG